MNIDNEDNHNEGPDDPPKTKDLTLNDLASVQILTRDLRAAARTLTHDEARFLVDAYYMMQEQRKRSDNQIRALSGTGEPHDVLGWFAKQADRLESAVKVSLDVYSANNAVGRWARTQVGIGPVLAAGLLAHIDIERANTAGKIWRYAGLDPTSKWLKGQKRPWNAQLKTLCWKIGESFMKVSGNENATYGHIYVHRKKLEIERNEKLMFAPQAEEILRTKKIGKDTEAYKAYIQGKLPPAHILARAQRYAVKFFLSHYQDIAYRDRFGVAPPFPFIIEHGGHVNYVGPSEYIPPNPTAPPSERDFTSRL
jgi:hypothetical protein